MCESFLAHADIAPTSKREPAPAETAYAQAYTRGILRAAPLNTFCIVGRVGAILGTVARAHALDGGAPITGDALLVWIERAAFEFREATASTPHYWSGWQPFAFAKWMNMRGAQVAPKEIAARLQPLAPRRTR